MRDGDT